jgi:iron complex outermembrane receptor protein
MTNLKQLPNAIRFALFVGAASTASFGNAIAQDQDQDSAATLDRIEVTGSRIKRVDVETSQPVFILNREDIARNGQVSIGDILQDLTVSGSALNTTFNNGGDGSTTVDLRNLGANRSLVLVNGKRWVSSLGGAVDLNTIPVAAIERVEVLKDGASAIYGSDAVAGVVNIILRRDFDGLSVSSYYGENEEGDGEQQSHDFLFGATTDRSSVMVGAQYVKQEPISAGDREISSVPLFGFPANTSFPGQASSTGPFFRGFVPGRGVITLGRDGQAGTSPNDFIPFNFAIHGHNFAPQNFLVTPQERISLFTQASFDLTDNIRAFANVLYNERRSSQELASMPIVGGSAAGGRGGNVAISADNVFNPFDTDLDVLFQFRPLIEPRRFSQDVDTFYINYGFDGVFDFAGRSFAWDVGYIYTDNEERTITTGLFDWNRLEQGLGPSFMQQQPDGSLVARCGTATAVIDGCVPLNFFQGTENFTREMFDFASFVAQDTTAKESTVYNANLTGDLFDLPAGPLGFAVGYEYRKEEGFDQPDALIAAGNSTGNIRQPTRGEFSVDEFYGELAIPLLSDMFLAQELELRVAVRFSDFSNFGNTTNPSAGIRWKPYEDLLIRGNYAEGFRAPTISELFLGASDSFQGADDPCSSDILAALPPDVQATVTQRCLGGFGGVAPVPPGFTQTNSQIRTTIGGFEGLGPETTTSKTLGFVYSPNFIENFNISVDWYNIKLTNFIGASSGEFVLQDCFFRGVEDSCENISRDPVSGQVNSLIARNQNFDDGTEVEGWDIELDYRFNTNFGDFRFNWSNAYLSYFGDIGQPDGANNVGLATSASFPTPLHRLRSNATIAWNLGDFGASLSARYKSRVDEDCSGAQATAVALNARGITQANPCSNPDGSPQNPGGENKIGGTTYLDVQGTWRTPWNGQVTAGARNVGDKDPPLSFSAFANSFLPDFDPPGRFWYVQYTQNF